MSLVMTAEERERFWPMFTSASLAFPTKAEDRSRCRSGMSMIREEI